MAETKLSKSGNFGTFFPQKSFTWVALAFLFCCQGLKIDPEKNCQEFLNNVKSHMLSVFFPSLISIGFSISSSQIHAAVLGGGGGGPVAGVSLESVKIFRGIGGTMGTE